MLDEYFIALCFFKKKMQRCNKGNPISRNEKMFVTANQPDGYLSRRDYIIERTFGIVFIFNPNGVNESWVGAMCYKY